jgi:hypothetical protein
MPSTYTLIKGETLASSAASYTFTAIPSTFTDLVLRLCARTDTAYGTGGIFVKINGSTANSSITRLQTTNGTSAASNRATTSIWSYGLNTGTQTSNTFSSLELYLPNYANASANKPMSFSGVAENNATAGVISAAAGLFSSTTAISSLLLESLGGDNFVAGSSFYLYGIKKS